MFFARCGVWWAIIGVSDKFLAGWGAEGLWGPFGEGWGIAGVVHVVFGNISGISGEIQLLFLNYCAVCLPRSEALSPPDLPRQVGKANRAAENSNARRSSTTFAKFRVQG